MKQRKSKFVALTAVVLASSMLMSNLVFAEDTKEKTEIPATEVAVVAEKEKVVQAAKSILVAGEALEKEYIIVNDYALVPLMDTLNALEIETTWDFVANRFAITVNEEKKVFLSLGFPFVTTEPALKEKYTLHVDPVTHNNVTYISTDFFFNILGVPVVLEEGTLYVGAKEAAKVEIVTFTTADAGKEIEIIKDTVFQIKIDEEPAEGYWAVLVEGLEGAITVVVPEEVKAPEVKKPTESTTPTKVEAAKVDEAVPAVPAVPAVDEVEATKEEVVVESVTATKVVEEVAKAPYIFKLKANKLGKYDLVVSHPVTEKVEAKAAVAPKATSYVFHMNVVAEVAEVVEEKVYDVLETVGSVYTDADRGIVVQSISAQPFSVVLDAKKYEDQEITSAFTAGYGNVKMGKNAAGQLVFVVTPLANSRFEVSLFNEAGATIFSLIGEYK